MTLDNRSVFISYARKDDYIGTVDLATEEHTYHLEPERSFTRQMYNALSDAGIEVWWDREKMPNRGLTFLDEIKQAITECDYLIYVSGEKALESDYVQQEWQFARSICKPIIPVVRQGDYTLIPPEIGMGNAPDMRDMTVFDDKMAEVIRLLDDDVNIATLHNVPSLPDWYIERGEDVQDLQKALRADSVIPVVVTSKKQTLTVQGMGGLGKTTMATALCRECDVRYRFPDGIFWIEIGKTPSIPTRQADIGVKFGDLRDQYTDAQRGKSRLSDILQNKRVLIVLDDVWNHQHVEAFRVNAPQSRILVTTRNRSMHTYLGVERHEIDTLTDSEGVALIGKRLGQAIPEEHLHYDDAVAIVDLLGGHTLAISIAAARISEKGITHIPRFLQRLQARKDSGDSPLGDLNMHDEDKNYNLELSLAESYDDLSDERKAQFHALGVFAEDSTFDLPALQAVWDVADEFDAEDAVDEFLRLSLLTPTDDERYELHGLLRDYARGLCADEKLEDYSQRHFDYYHSEHGNYKRNIAYAEDGSMLRFDLIESDWENILSAIEWGYRHHAEQAVYWVYCVQNFMSMRRTHEERLSLLMEALDIANLNNNQLGQANALKDIGDVFYMQDQYDEAVVHYKQAMTLYQTFGVRQGQANTLRAIGDALKMQHDYENAISHYQQALPLYQSIEDRLGEANTLRAIGGVLRLQHDYENAVSRYQQALTLYKSIGDRLGEANTLHSLSDVLIRQDDYENVVARYQQALTLFQSIKDRLGEANTLKSIGDVLYMQDEHEDAVSHYQKALTLFQSIGSRMGEANTLKALGMVYRVQNNYDVSIDSLSKAYNLYESIGERLGQANTLEELGDVHRLINEYDKTIQYYKKALIIAKQINDLSSQLNSLRGLAFTYHAQNDDAQACIYATQLIQLANSHDFFKDHPITQGWRKLFDSWGCDLDDD